MRVQLVVAPTTCISSLGRDTLTYCPWPAEYVTAITGPTHQRRQSG